jgi:type I restriction-modification system DNA methylase subunit
MDYKKEIVRSLSKLAYTGIDQSTIFDDWLDVVQASLEAIPQHLQNASGDPLEDTPETQAIFKRVQGRYRGDFMPHFAEAFAFLSQSTVEWRDTIGDVYMDYGMPNKWTGQFFTPWPVAKMMADMTVGNIIEDVKARIVAGIKESIAAQALLFAGLSISDPLEAERYHIERILPAALPHVKPVTIQDPCCGSGVMLLAAASCCPRWALDFGIVQFYGQDLDQTCVKMAKVNCMLYGLNGFHLKCALNVKPEEIAALPEPYQSAYADAQEANERGDAERVQAITMEIKTGNYVQQKLFEMVG